MKSNAERRRKSILARRSRFVAMAVAGAGVAAAAASCQPCLKLVGPREDAGKPTATAAPTAASTAMPAELIVQDGGAVATSTSTSTSTSSQPKPPTD